MKKALLTVLAVVAASAVLVVNTVCVVYVFGDFYVSRQSDESGFNRLFLNADVYCGDDNINCHMQIAKIAKRDAYF